MSTGFTRIAALAVPVLLAAACSKKDDNANAANANMPAPADTAMYTPPPAPADTMGMMRTDSMRHDSMMGADTTHRQ